MYNNIYKIKHLIPNTDYLMFKEDIKPEWEHPKNQDGGKWVVTLPVEDHVEEECQYAWDMLVMHLVGAQYEFEQYELINGIVLGVRDKHYRISVWVSNNEKIELLKQIGDAVRDMTQLKPKYSLDYQVHQKAIEHKLDNQAFLRA